MLVARITDITTSAIWSRHEQIINTSQESNTSKAAKRSCLHKIHKKILCGNLLKIYRSRIIVNGLL